MRELGATAAEEHRLVGELAATLGIDRLVAVGHGAHGVYDAFVAARGGEADARHVETVEQAVEWVRQNVAGPDVVLVKASRSARLERVAEDLVREPIEEQGEEPA
jgi:UDP-N-acetylmuramoyl-tripeptide--D-alanyl-D-alanine ligase